MMLFPEIKPSTGPSLARKVALVAATVLAAGGAGTLIVKAGDTPDIYQTILKFNRPVRQAVQPYLPQPQAALPRIFQRRERAPVQALSYAPRTEPLRALPRVNETVPVRGQQAGTTVLPAADSPDPTTGYKPRGRHKLQARGEKGSTTAMNYCVRLCDGFAFPVGNAGGGNWNVQESACRSACPGAETALFYSPAGSKDFDSMTRGRLAYTALPTAFRYRSTLSPSCSCKPVGATQSSLALLTDYTLRAGDLAMTRIGARHFDGARRFPYRGSDFSDAISRLKSKKEVAIVRAMEVASVRGVMPADAPPGVRSRVISEIRRAEAQANQARPRDSFGLPRGFSEVTRREARGPIAMRPVKRMPGFVAMN